MHAIIMLHAVSCQKNQNKTFVKNAIHLIAASNTIITMTSSTLISPLVCD